MTEELPGDAPTAVVTGGNRGIGFAVAEQLRDAGRRVVLVARDAERGEAARAALAALGGPGVALVVGDLATVRGARRVAEALLAECPRIDVLVHNAGIWPARLQCGEEGLEQAFVTNHLAPFLLNHALTPRLAASRARVVQVSAGLHVKGRVDLARTPVGADFSPLRSYADTKLCNLLLLPRFARHWAGAGVTINAVHPGVIRTGLGDRGGPLGALLKVVKLTWQHPAEGARPVVRLAVDPELDGVSGRYFDVETEAPLSAVASDAALADRVWDQALELTGLARARPGTAHAD